MINKNIWHEKLHRHLGQYFLIDQMLYQEKNKHHDIKIFCNSVMGKIMTIDDIVQTTEKDEFIYHEMLSHVPIFAHGLIEDVLIIGGGDGGILREVCKHKNINSITIVEIDISIINLCKKYFPNHSKNAYEDPRVQLVIDDGLKFVQNTNKKFDLIISDSTDPIGCGEHLFFSDFYLYCKKNLKKNGLFVAQNGIAFFQTNEIISTYKHLRKYFYDTSFYHSTIPTYYGGLMMFAWGSDNVELRSIAIEELKSRIKKTKLTFNYYTPQIHASSFFLPQYIINILDKS